MKQKKKIKGKAIALRCNQSLGSLLTKDKIYLGTPTITHNYFHIHIPNYPYFDSKTILLHNSLFDPINPLHKYDPRFY